MKERRKLLLEHTVKFKTMRFSWIFGRALNRFVPSWTESFTCSSKEIPFIFFQIAHELCQTVSSSSKQIRAEKIQFREHNQNDKIKWSKIDYTEKQQNKKFCSSTSIISTKGVAHWGFTGSEQRLMALRSFRVLFIVVQFPVQFLFSLTS